MASYQTAPLSSYAVELRERAVELYRRVLERVGPARAKQYKGSFSVLAEPGGITAAKVLIIQTGKGKFNGADPLLGDGVYVLVRVPSSVGGRALGVAPKHDERFAYFRLAAGLDLDEISDFISACGAAK